MNINSELDVYITDSYGMTRRNVHYENYGRDRLKWDKTVKFCLSSRIIRTK